VVDETVDRYVADEFKGDELERVRNYFFKSTDRQDKLRFARTLKERERKEPPPSPNPKPIKRRGWLPTLSFAPAWALAASFIVVAGIGLLAYRSYSSRPDPREGLVALQSAFRERPVEGRLSDFGHVPLPNQRGASPKVDYVQRDLAATLLLKSVRDNPTAASHHAAAKYYLMNHQFEQAEKEFAAALSLEPKNAKIHNDFGSMFLEQGRLQNLGSDNGKQFELYARGLEEVQTALDLDDSLLEAHLIAHFSFN